MGANDGPPVSLYRRYRPGRFAEVVGQDHVVRALQNAVASDHVGHAYLFSGPRGTGKTSTARILAKALNCAERHDGEPCGTCHSCVAIASGASFDVLELDAASNNGVDAMRELVSRAATESPGLWKVYIIDEVHMLSTAASNALLKTLEEPPRHVVFILATTDPHKVLPTIRSRTQHLEFRLLPPALVTDLLERISSDAKLNLPERAITYAVQRGRGSARDALSALEQVTAAGEVEEGVLGIAELADDLASADAPKLLASLDRVLQGGLEPDRVALELVEYLRHGFLTLLGAGTGGYGEQASASDPEGGSEGASERGPEADRREACARSLGLAGVVRAMETIGRAGVECRDFPDARIPLELSLVRLVDPRLDTDSTALLQRIERIEARLGAGSSQAQTAPGNQTPSPVPGTSVPPGPAGTPQVPAGSSPVPAGSSPGPAGSSPGRAASLGAFRRAQSPARPVAAAPGAEDAPRPVPEPTARPEQASFPSRDDLVTAWGDHILPQLRGRARALYRAGRFVAVDGNEAVFALPSAVHRSYCEPLCTEVQAAIQDHFKIHVPLRLVVEDSTEGPSAQASDPSPASPPDTAFHDTAPRDIQRITPLGSAPTAAPGSPAASPEASYGAGAGATARELSEELANSSWPESDDDSYGGSAAPITPEALVLQVFPGAEEEK